MTSADDPSPRLHSESSSLLTSPAPTRAPDRPPRKAHSAHLVRVVADEPSGDYADLRRRVRAAGLLNRSYRYYVVLATLLSFGLVVLAAILWLLPGIGDFVAVPLLTFLLVQIGMLAHDAGHNQIFDKPARNRVVGFICMPLFLALSFEDWMRTHNTHHAHTNQIGEDPDITHPILVFTREQAQARRGLARRIVRFQAYLYPVIALGAAFSLRADAWTRVFRKLPGAGALRELALISVGLAFWVAVPSLLFGLSRWLVIFALAQVLIGPYLVWLFAPNHKGMPIVTGHRPSFLEHQVLTSRNVYGGPIFDVLYGGLNYQIEHHLFPNMPRNRLPACRTLVRRFCAEAGISYAEEGVFASYRTVLCQLDEIGRGGSAPELALGTG